MPPAHIALWQLFFAVVLLLCFVCVPFSFFIKLFIDIFSAGRSDFKVLFFLSFILGVFCLRYAKPITPPRILPLFNLTLAGVLFLIGVCEYFSLSARYFAEPGSMLHMQYMDVLSTTRFYHIHNAKGVLAWLIQWLPFVKLSHYDYGLPYLYFHPGCLFGLQAALYILFFALTFYQLRTYDRFTPSLYALFVMCCFIVLRNILDGGLFFCETLAAFPIYGCIQWSLWQRGTPALSPRLWKALIVTFGGITLIALYCYILQNSWFVDNPLRYVMLLAFLFTIYTVFYALEKNRPWLAGQVVFLFCLCFGTLSYFDIYTSWGTYQLGFITQEVTEDFTAVIPKGALAVARENDAIAIKQVVPIGEMAVVTARPKQPIRLWQLSSLWKLHINYASVDVYNKSCSPQTGYTIDGAIEIITSASSFRYFKKKYGTIVFELTPATHAPAIYALKLSLPGCTPDSIELLKAILADIGITRSVMKLNPHIF